MFKPAKVLLFYYVFLGVSSILLSVFHVDEIITYTYAGKEMEFQPMIIPIIIGGLISLRLTVSAKSFKIFVKVYVALWILRFLLLYIANTVGGLHIFGRFFRVDLIVNNYYKTVSRLDTHLPFVLYWFVNHFFGSKTQEQNTDVNTQQESVTESQGQSKKQEGTNQI